MDKHAQANGLYYVTEYHKDSAGFVHTLPYGPVSKKFDCKARLENTARLLDQLTTDELDKPKQEYTYLKTRIATLEEEHPEVKVKNG